MTFLSSLCPLPLFLLSFNYFQHVCAVPLGPQETGVTHLNREAAIPVPITLVTNTSLSAHHPAYRHDLQSTIHDFQRKAPFSATERYQILTTIGSMMHELRTEIFRDYSHEAVARFVEQVRDIPNSKIQIWFTGFDPERHGGFGKGFTKAEALFDLQKVYRHCQERNPLYELQWTMTAGGLPTDTLAAGDIWRTR